jgi:ubiquinone/menaquinone biosynthesis C-methylase UbiE
MTETFQITPEQAEAYEEFFVPALFAQWAEPLVDLAGVGAGDRVLDVACGTGVAARAAADRIGSGGSVTGVDLNPAMLQVARRLRPDLDWREGDAAALPFESGAFDVVLCQSALFFFPDVPAAVADMGRVLCPGGRLALQTYASAQEQPAFLELQQIVARYAPPEAMHLMQTYWSQGDLAALLRTVEQVGLAPTDSRTTLGTATYASIDALIDIEVGGTPLVERVSEAEVERIRQDAQDSFARYLGDNGRLELPIRAHLLAARREA